MNVTAIPNSLSSDFFRTKTSGDWGNTATWESSHDGSIWFSATLTPTTSANTITVLNTHTVTVTTSVSADQLTVNSGGQITVNSGQTLTIANGAGTDLTVDGTIATAGTITNSGTAQINNILQINEGGWAGSSGTYTYGAAGTLVFNNSSGPYGVNSGDTWWPAASGPVNVTVQNAGGITMSTARTVSGIFQTTAGVVNASSLTFNGTARINTGGFFDSAPNYGTGSTLVYNTGATYGRGSEWSATSGAGYPYHVTINSGSSLNLGNGAPGTARQLAGNLQLDGALYMDFGGSQMTQPLTVLGNLTFGTAGALSLSTSAGGDLKLQGNWTRNGSGTFTHNNRAVFFQGGNAQSITGVTTFAYLNMGKSANNLTLVDNITINNVLTLSDGTNGGNANGGVIDAVTNNKTVILASNATSAVGGASTTSYINGNLRRAIATGANTYAFPVGTSGAYTPATLTFSGSGVTTPGNLTAKANTGTLSGHALSTVKFLNRHWNLSNSGLVFAAGSASVAFDYLAADLSGGAVATNLKIAKFDSPTWSYPSTNAVAYTVTATGMSSFSDFAAAECEAPSISVGPSPTVCQGTVATSLSYSNPIGSPDQYSIDFDAAAEAAGFMDVAYTSLPGSPITLIVPGGAAAGVYNASIKVRNTLGSCEGNAVAFTITVNATPTISVGSGIIVCSTTLSASLSYTSTGSPNQYSIDFDAAAESAGFADVAYTSLPASPLTVLIPGGAAVGTYNATIKVRNTATACESSSVAFTITVNPIPTITLGASPVICLETASANLPYTSTTGSPNQYRIDYDAAAELAGFADVTYTTLPASPIVLTIPGAAAGTYNATISVVTAVACESAAVPFTVTINAIPNVDIDVTPTVCQGTTTANLAYTNPVGSPDQYSINYDAVAESAGFMDVVNATLTATPIVLTVPATAPPALYDATITVRNSIVGCEGLPMLITVMVNTPATANAGGPYTACGATPVNITAVSNVLGTWSGGAGTFGDAAEMATTYTPDASEIGTTVTLTWTSNDPDDDDPCVAASATTTVTVNTPATASAGGPYTTCGTTPVNVTATANGSGSWSGGAGSFTAPTSPATTYTPGIGESGAVTLTWTTNDPDAGGPCVAVSSTATLTISNPEIDITGLGVSIVDGDTTPDVADDTEFGSTATTVTHTFTVDNTAGTTSLNVASITSSDAVQFAVGALTPASPVPAGATATFSVTFDPASAGLHTATITVNNDDCNEAVYDFAVQGTGLILCPTITFTATPSPFCTGGQAGQIAITGESGGQTPYSYSIDNGANYFPTAIFTGLTAGVYSVKIKDANNCESAVTSVTVGTVTQKTADAGVDWTTCINGVVQLNGSIGGGATSGSWSDGGIGGTFQNANALFTKYTPPAGYSSPITITLTTNGPCAGSDNLTINFATPPTLLLETTAPATATCGDIISVTVSTAGGFIDISSLQYSVQWDPTKLTYLSHTPTAIGGDLPGVLTQPDLPAGQLTYVWFDGTGVEGEDLANGSTLLTISFQVIGSTGSAAVNISGTPTPVEGTNSQFCVLPYTLQNNASTTLQPITVGISGTSTICNGQSTTLTASGGTTFLWSTGATSASIIVSPTTTTTYSVIVSNANGCSNTATQVVTVNPTPSVSISGITTICEGNSTTLTASGGTTYVWSNGDVTAATTVSPTVTTSYTVTATSLGCSATASATVTVNPLETVDAGADQSTCDGGFVHLAGTVGGGASGGIWTANVPGGSFAPDATTLTAYYFPPSGYTGSIILTLTTNGPCPVTDNMTVTYGALPPLVLTASGPATATCGDQITFDIVSTSGFTDLSSLQYSINWDITKFSFVSHTEFPIGGGAPAFDASNTGIGQLNYVWSDPMGFDGEDLPNGTVLQQIVLQVLVSSGSYGISITDNPTPVEASNSQLCVLPISLNSTPTTFNPIAVTCPASSTVCFAAPAFALTGGSPAGGTYSGTGVSGGMFNAVTAGAGAHVITYSYTDANGCSNSCTFTITVSPQLVLTFNSVTPVSCNGGSNGAIDISVSGGTPAYTYDWSNDGPETPDNDPQDLTGLTAGTYSVTVTDANGCTVTNFASVSEPAALLVTVSSVTGVLCNGGSNGAIDITVTGGTGAYTYDWSNDGPETPDNDPQDLTGLVAGTYTVTVTDANGCTATQVATVAEPSALVIAVVSTPVSCNGGSNGAINITVTGGAGSYTYDWSNDGPETPDNDPEDLTGLTAGVYTVTVTDANGCTITASATITQPTVIQLSFAVTGVLCNGGSTGAIDLSVTGGTGAYTYDWSNDGPENPDNDPQDLTGLTAGTYSVTVTDANGCSVTNFVFVSEPALLAITSATVTPVLCNGAATGAIDITVNGGTGAYTYDWSNDGPETPDNDPQDLTGLTAGTYTVTVTDANGCTVTQSFNVTQPPAINISVSSTDVACNGAATGSINITVTGGTGSFTFDWSNDGPETPDNDPEDLSGLTAGTYTVTVTDGNGCSATASAIINQPSALQLSSTQVNILCNGAATGSIDLSVSGGAGSYTYDWSNDGPETPDNDPQDLFNLIAGDYTVTVTDANGCTSTLAATLTQPSALTLSIVSVTNIPCNGGTNGAIYLGVSGGTTAYTFDWSNDGPETPDNDTQDLLGVTAGTYTVTVTDANNCTATISATINQSAPIVLSIQSVTNAQCGGVANGAIDINVSGGAGGFTYDWSNDGPETPDNDPQDLTGLSGGTYTVTVTDANGCTATISATVSQASTLVLSNTHVDVLCNGAATGSIDLTVSGGTPAYTYDWSDDGPENPDNDAQDLFNLIAGTYTVTVTDANGCTATSSATVTQPSALTLSIVSVTNIPCNGGNNGAIYLGVSGGTTAYTFDWSNDGPETPDNDTQNLLGVTAGTYTVTVTDANNCTATISATITESAAIVLGIQAVTPVNCFGGATGAIDINVSGGAGGFTYDWSNDGPETPDNDPQDLTGLSAGTYTVTVTDAFGCTATISATITQPAAALQLSTIVTNVLCNGGSNGAIDLTVTGGTTGYTYDWSNDGPETPDNDPQDLTGLSAGTYTVTVTDANGCTATTSATITQAAALLLNVLTVNELCNGGNTGSIDLSVSGGTGAYSYDWSNDGPEDPDNDPQDLTGLTAGTYTVTVTDANGCTATTSATISQPAALVVTVTDVLNVNCNGGTNGAIFISVTGGTGVHTYDWSNDGPETPDNDPQNLSGVGAGTYTVTVTDANGCTATVSATITQPSVISLSTAVTPSCTGGSNGAIDLTVSGGTPGYTYDWSNDGPETPDNDPQDLSGLPAGTYTVTVTDANGCSAVTNATVNQSTAITLSTTTSPTCSTTGSIDLTVSGGTPGYTYDWSNDGPEDPDNDPQDLTGLGAGTYTVTVTDANGCSATTSATVVVNPPPTAFTVTGGGAICTTDNVGVPVGLSGSQVNVNYQLQVNNTNTGAPVAGTGAAISFGPQLTPGTYTVIATSVPAACTAVMTGSVTISAINCNITISDPCVCLNNATTLTNGQFGETIKINAPGTQTWTVTAINGLYQPGGANPPAAPTAIPVGTTFTNLGAAMNMFQLVGKHVDAIGYTITVSNGQGTTLTIGNSCEYPNPSITSDLSNAFCLNSNPVTLTGNPGDANIVSEGFTVNGTPATEFDPAQGVGSYVIVYTVNGGVPKAFGVNDPGCTQSVSQTVNVVATPSVLNCNDHIYVSLPGTCVGEILPDDILEGTYGCYDDYLVELDKTLPLGNGPWLSGVLGANDIGRTYQVRVKHLVSNNSCWGLVTIEDNVAPSLTCENFSIPCNTPNVTPNYLFNVLGIAQANPTVSDCQTFTLTYIDTDVQQSCASGFTKIITRKWTAVDASGNSSTCIQTISLIRPTLADVVTPPDYDGIDAQMFSCTDNAFPTPQWIEAQGLQGFPYVFGGTAACNIDFAYEDLVIKVCDGTYKIRREWTILDWCVGDGIVYNQIIKVVDNTGPVMTCPETQTVSINPFQCCATTNLPDIILEDNCSRINNISGMVVTFDQYTGEQSGMYTFGGSVTNFPGNNLWDLDTMGAFGWIPCLPIGTHTVTYIAEDDCGNTSSCEFELNVEDQIPPISVCDQVTTVGIGADGYSEVNASTFDDGSYDNCCFDGFEVRRMNSNGCSGTSFGPTVGFCCEDVGETIMVVFRAYDCHGNSNDCMVSVTVQEKIKPYCQPPAHVTVACEQFDPTLWLYGKPDVLDNCCLDETKVYQGQEGLTHSASYTQFDTVCNKGTIIRTFRAFDCHGQTSQCTQRVVVNYNQDYFVKFPNDVIVTVCDGTGNYGEPIYFGEDCELLGATYQDAIFTVVPDACFKIERTWKIINWCTYNSNLPCINVPNPNPAAISNAPANLPGPTVSRCGTLAPWAPTVVKINPTDAVATNFCTFWDANANCYIYKQIIKIIDGIAPTVVGGCPASPDTICDITPNNNQLWNDMPWWDNTNQSHDLCEAPSDICITATDACSGSNINIEYQLFLDLDGDGVMETIINSINTGIAGLGWNAVPFGNANGGAGVIRTFDGRPVNPNQKYGFAIQETVSGNNKTACVRFNTQQAQNTFVPAELPYGTHKIKWFISDGCGNESVCEYTIIIRDCKAPTVVCYHGLSVNIMPGGMIGMWDTDFLQYTEDNCTQAPYLKTAIRKCGQGTGFPVDANGQPVKSVTFTCDELGEQCVEIWSIDLAGNADYCQTYIDVQDNNGNCTNSGMFSVAGDLKTETELAIKESTVEIFGTVSSAPPFFKIAVTDDAGHYAKMFSIPPTSDYTIKPVKDDNPLNGVTTYDLVLISKHILGVEPLGSPYRMIAADANKSNSITTFDIVELRKLILGIYVELPNNTSWRFVDKAYQFPNPQNPFTAPIPETISYTNTNSDKMNENFVGVKIGDVNATVVTDATAQQDDRSAGTLLFDVDDRQVKAGEEFEVTFTTAERTQGYQMTLNLKGLEVAEIVESGNVTANNFGVFADAMTVSVDGADAFTVKFRATKSGKLSEMMSVSSRITKAEAYSMVDGRMDVALRFDGKTIAGIGFELYQNEPNPFVNKTAIGFHLPETTTATLTVYDETGRLVFTQKGDFAKGYNSILLDRALMNTTGVLYYSLETATDAATRKMIQVK